ncbi:MAG: hypothetical protein QXN05_04295 [Acidilobaceae archaeon]
MSKSEFEKLLIELEKLKKMVENEEVEEATARAKARSLSNALRKYGYLVVVRRRPRWSRGSKIQVFLSRLGRRGRGGTSSEPDDYFPDTTT